MRNATGNDACVTNYSKYSQMKRKTTLSAFDLQARSDKKKKDEDFWNEQKKRNTDANRHPPTL